jgi:fatty acid desaturase
MSPGKDARVDAMFGSDRIAAIVALAALWATLAFVFVSVIPLAGSSEVLYVLAAGVGMVLLFNTASIIALISHYSEDRQHIYGLDLHYLDEMKKSKI